MPKQVFDIHAKRIVLVYDPSEIVFVTTTLGLQPQLADEGRYVDVSEPHTVEQDGVQRRAYALNDGTVAIQDHQGRFSITKDAPNPVDPVNTVQARDALPADPNATVDPALSPAPALEPSPVGTDAAQISDYNTGVTLAQSGQQLPDGSTDVTTQGYNDAVSGNLTCESLTGPQVANPTSAPSDQASLASAS